MLIMLRAAPTSVRVWTPHAGLDGVDGLAEHLEALASSRVDLAFLTDEDWARTLAPLPLKLGKRRRVEAAIRELREQNRLPLPPPSGEQREINELQRMFNSGGTPLHRVSPVMRPRSADSSTPQGNFLPSATFVGARPNFVFKSGPLGLGYYRDRAPSASQGGMGSVLRDGTPAHGRTSAAQHREWDTYAQEHEAAVRAQEAAVVLAQRRQLQAMRTPPPKKQTRHEVSPRTQARADAHARLMARPF